MNTTKILGEAVGIQSQGTVDKTETLTNEGLTSALIIGRFMRGRVDKPMTIHQGNIRGQLGYQPDNIDYNAVQDCLDTGVSSVQVLRVGPESNSPLISCAGATQGIRFFDFSSPMLVYVDDELLIDAPYGYKDEVLWSNYDIDLYSDDSGLLSLLNNGTTARRIKFFLHDDAEPNVQDNPTFVDLGNNIYGFCLAPNSNQISCVGATSIINFPYIEGNWRFYLDDFEFSVVTGLANDFTSYLNTEMVGKLRGDFDGFFWVENLDTQPHRIKMSPNNSEGAQFFTPPTDNPTFVEHEDGSLTFCLSASLNIQECNPTVLTIPDFVIPDVMAVYTYSYRINGGEIITTTENAGGAPSQTVFTNIMAYYGLFSELVTNDIGQKAFRAKYGEPIRGGSITDPNFIQSQSNTIEFLLTENAEHDLIETIFGHSITLHSCAIVNWV